MTYGDGGQRFNQDYFQLFALFTIQNHILYLFEATKNANTQKRDIFCRFYVYGAGKKMFKMQGNKNRPQPKAIYQSKYMLPYEKCKSWKANFYIVSKGKDNNNRLVIF